MSQSEIPLKTLRTIHGTFLQQTHFHNRNKHKYSTTYPKLSKIINDIQNDSILHLLSSRIIKNVRPHKTLYLKFLSRFSTLIRKHMHALSPQIQNNE
jgi:hypothetical protein